MQKRSTVTTVVVTQFIADCVDNRSQVDVVYLDFSKAFDKISQAVLLNKLDSFGFSSHLISFFRSYLSNRRLYVYINRSKSESYRGVPQGSVLGPLLFNIFVNDVVSCLNVKHLLYADDIKIFCRISSIDDCHRLQNNLLLIMNWCEVNNLQVNVAKCNVTSFSKWKKQ
jgi:retron-type reverse transcriptase